MRLPGAVITCAVLAGAALSGCSAPAPGSPDVVPAQTVLGTPSAAPGARATAPGATASAPAATATAPPATASAPAATATAPPATATAPPATATVPGATASFRWQVSPATKTSLGASWRRGCPVGPASLRSVSLRYWGFDGRVHDGVIVLHQDILTRTRAVFATMYQRRFPLRSVIPVSAFPKASDDASMAADNTSAFNCRNAVASGAPTWSRHAYGKAIDVNPVENPYLFGTKVLPPAGARYTNRSAPHPGLIRRGDPIHQRFIAAGFRWGGDFSNPDYQHFDR